MRVGLWAPNAGTNMGNEMTMAAVIQNLRKFKPNIEICGFTFDPADTEKRHGIPSFPIYRWHESTRNGHVSNHCEAPNRTRTLKERLGQYPNLYKAIRWTCNPLLELAFIKKARRALSKVDLLMFAGTGAFSSDWGGAAGFPYRIFQWSHLCRFSGTKVALLSVGAGPLDSVLSRCLIRSALSGTAYRSFRDHQSKALIESLGVKGQNHVSPDLVFSLDYARQTPAPDSLDRTVVLHGLPYRKPVSWDNADRNEYDRYLESMAKITVSLLTEGYTVRLVPTQFEMDPVFIKDLQDKVRVHAPKLQKGQLIAKAVDSFDQVIAELSKASMVIASRFHAAIFSYLLAKPVLALSYHPKIRELSKDFGQEDFCLDIKTLDAVTAMKRFQALKSTSASISSAIQQQVDRYRRALEQQYEAVLQL